MSAEHPRDSNTLTDCVRSGLLEMCLDLNQNPSIPPELRFDLSIPDPPKRVSTGDQWIKSDVTPEEANETIMSYNLMVRQGKIPPLDLVEVRSQIDARLAAQGTQSLESIEHGVNRPVGSKSVADVEQDLSFMPFEQEMDYLARLDAKLSRNGDLPSDPRYRDIEQEKHYADLTPRELERKTEFDNPQSQHNWLKTHTKVLGADADGEDTESLASHDLGGAGGSKPSNKRKSAGKGSLAKQVGDRAVERARDGSAAPFSNDEDELASDAGGLLSATGKKRARDTDGTYRLKGAKSIGGKGKRKRSGEDMLGSAGAGSGKKAKMEGSAGDGGAGSAMSGMTGENVNGGVSGSGMMVLG